jgi:predicted transcriptional regulator
MNLDYKIAEDYLNKLPEADKLKLINRTLGEVTKAS